MTEVYIMSLNIGTSVLKNNYRYFIDFGFCNSFLPFAKSKELVIEDVK